VERFVAEQKIKVRVLQRCFVEQAMRQAGDELLIPESTFSPSVFEKIEPPAPASAASAPVASDGAPPGEAPGAPAPEAPVHHTIAPV